MAANYEAALCEVLKRLSGNKKRLLLHCCCAPCATYVPEYLCEYFDVTAVFFNPNIQPAKERNLRERELCRLTKEMDIPLILPNNRDVQSAIPEESTPSKEGTPFFEGGERCAKCYKFRLEKTAKIAKNHDFEYFCTTLSVSPRKNAAAINTLGEELAKEYGVKWLPSDFKKRDGYKKSVELSKKYNLYRQSYCGCTPP